MEYQNVDNDPNKGSFGKMASKIERHSIMVEKGLILGLWFCAAIMFLILLCGIYKITTGVYYMVYNSIKYPKFKSTLLSDILNGLELIFVSPLIYLLMLSLLKYINVVRPRIDSDLDKKNKFLNNALLEIMTVKILNVALFISILILHSIDLVFKSEMSMSLIIYTSVLLIILIIYYCLLDFFANALKKRLP